MKHLCGRFESQPLTGAVIQPVFDHFNFLDFYVLHRAFLGHILAQQAVEVFIATTLPTRKGSSKVACAIKRRVNQCMPTEFFAVIEVSVLTLTSKGFSALLIAWPTRSAVLFETLAMTAYPLLCSTTVTMACLLLAPMTVSHSQ
jgi:hypothetical protein